MRFIPTPTSMRLVGGFVLVLAIFAAGAILSMRNLERIIEATDEIRDLQDGREQALRVEGFARRMDAAIADVTGGGELDEVEVFKAAVQNMRTAREGIGRFAKSDTERKWLVECAEISRQVEAHFDQHLVPAVIAGDEDTAWLHRRRCRELLESLITLNEKLTRAQEMKMDNAQRVVHRVRIDAVRDSGLLLGAAVLVAMAVALLTARSIAKPIEQLVEATQALASGDLSRRVAIRRRDELGRLAESFNKMGDDLLEHQQRLIQAEKMASLGRLAAGVAHEINNPIGVIGGYAKLLAKEPALPPAIADDIRVIREEAELCERIVQELLAFSRPAPPTQEVVDLRKVVEEVLERTRRSQVLTGVTIATDFGADRLPVRADSSRLAQAIENIVRNAFEAMTAGGTLKVSLRVDRTPGESDRRPAAEASFQDTGGGIEPEHKDRLFEPFFSTKPKGTGLGLSIAYAAIRAYNGTIRVESEPQQGATFTIHLPLADGDQEL